MTSFSLSVLNSYSSLNNDVPPPSGDNSVEELAPSSPQKPRRRRGFNSPSNYIPCEDQGVFDYNILTTETF